MQKRVTACTKVYRASTALWLWLMLLITREKERAQSIREFACNLPSPPLWAAVQCYYLRALALNLKFISTTKSAAAAAITRGARLDLHIVAYTHPRLSFSVGTILCRPLRCLSYLYKTIISRARFAILQSL